MAFRVVAFSHVGDGNLHYQPVETGSDRERRIHCHAAASQSDRPDIVHQLGGSISAEHGIGQLKRAGNPALQECGRNGLMRAVKQAFDRRA
ncbi:MAG: hypothetical protein IPJ48_05235 [Propionivibrio sp.]|uniref:FAD-binding oxidoreductase/transferase type 4 C-terminal domain-containing protein n=1 Tax=Candidatus Propionivibrio dominans TaxID=2954373 RepID=A0A9D7FB26_9RHOO|nr:hypothetical protein [Candidatus Propionivibrio dominans]